VPDQQEESCHHLPVNYFFPLAKTAFLFLYLTHHVAGPQLAHKIEQT